VLTCLSVVCRVSAEGTLTVVHVLAVTALSGIVQVTWDYGARSRHSGFNPESRGIGSKQG
jgi:hypothetical protein